MRKLLLFALLLLVPPSGAPEAAAPRKGTIRSVEVTSLSRQKAHLFVRTRLPAVARGARQTFRGEATAWGVPVPIGLPVHVAVQRSGEGWDAVFLVDLDLAAAPRALVEKGSPTALPVTLRGTLSGDAGTAVRVDAAGALRPGTSDLVASRELGDSFVRFAGARLSGLGLAESNGEARIAVFNPFGFDVALRAIRYELSSGGRVVARGSRQGLLVRPGRENEIVLPLTLSNAAALATAAEALVAGGTLTGRLSGELVLKLGTGDVTFPLAASGTIEVLR
jgi:hypothetical protein